MFLRRYERRSGGRRRTYRALVACVRTGRGSRQRLSYPIHNDATHRGTECYGGLFRHHAESCDCSASVWLVALHALAQWYASLDGAGIQ